MINITPTLSCIASGRGRRHGLPFSICYTRPTHSKSPVSCERWIIDDLDQLVRSFHNASFVHGDLREPNILCNGETVMLIDFDWGGKEGEAYYLTAKLSPELMDGHDSTSRKITKSCVFVFNYRLPVICFSHRLQGTCSRVTLWHFLSNNST
ncbi:hypothetical protein BC827DRAFT_173575 [Russula dissimulans]|nr:hypothetical protein BC827DRAFT_173575 [Russula dissimulans]